MSYILEALRKADAERERGAVPGLHTQTVPTVPGDAPGRAPVKPFVWMGLGAAVVLAGALAWTLTRSDPPEVAVASLPPAVPGAASAAITVAAAPVAPPTVAAPPVVPPTPVPVAATTARAETKAKPAVKRPVTDEPPPAERKPTRALGAARPVVPTAAASAAVPERVYAIGELPETIRRSMPALNIGGSIYSPTPASRFLIINGRIFHEGDKVADELTLQEIKLKAAVLQYKGYRVGITY